MGDAEVVNPEVIQDLQNNNTDLMRTPAAPVTLAEIAALGQGAKEIIEARIQVLETLRRAAIRATNPEDWLLFRSPDGLVIGFLQDCGCDRVRDLYGIEIFDVSHPERIEKPNAGDFAYIITGSGRCSLTRQIVESIEGGRFSTDDFCRGKTGIELELSVRKAARANLDGNVTRELAGMKSVPLGELKSAWEGTHKKHTNCRLGRGFGSSASRQGADVEETPGVKSSEAPKCPTCGGPTKFKPAGTTKAGKPFGAFWSCAKYPQCRGTVKYEGQQQPAENGPTADKQPEITDDDIPF